jgi:DNA-3-methyladenine glycosylase II
MIIDEHVAKEAAEHLRQADAKFVPIVAQYGLCPIRAHKEYYRALVGEIIGQQLSVKAAASIRKRFELLFGDTFPEPEAILQKSVEELRTVGLSQSKANYIRDLAQHITDGKLQFDHLDDLSNEAVILELTDVKGIGEWTAHMFLMFCMGRSDILAYGDLGIRNAIKKLYGLDHAPSPQEVEVIVKNNQWHPYETIACWYLWQSLENMPTVP